MTTTINLYKKYFRFHVNDLLIVAWAQPFANVSWTLVILSLPLRNDKKKAECKKNLSKLLHLWGHFWENESALACNDKTTVSFSKIKWSLKFRSWWTAVRCSVYRLFLEQLIRYFQLQIGKSNHFGWNCVRCREKELVGKRSERQKTILGCITHMKSR